MDAVPEWTERSEKRGLDPLGLQNSGVALYQKLLPGISNVTLRMRYYGLYCWLSNAYARASGSTDATEWQKWVRRCEAVYALAAALSGDEAGVAGVEWAAEALKDANRKIDFRDATLTKGPRLYLRQAMGVFGGAYASQLAEMEFMEEANAHDLLVPTRNGHHAAHAFASAIGPDVEACLIEAIRHGAITHTSLQRLLPALPSAIGPDTKEALLYREVLLGERELEAKDGSRRASLLLILRVAQSLRARPTPDEIRWALFDNSLHSLPTSLEAQRLRWEAYQAHDLFQLAFAGLLRWSLDRLGEQQSDLNGLVETSIDRMASEGVLAQAATWSELVAQHLEQPHYRTMATALSRTRITGTISVGFASHSLSIIAALQARVVGRADLRAEIDRSFPLSEFARSIRSELAFLQTFADRTIRDTVAALLSERILRRHSWVAMQKFRRRDYTFLFEADDGRLRLRSKYSPVLTTPRLGPTVNFLEDVGLVTSSGVTKRGSALAEIAA